MSNEDISKRLMALSSDDTKRSKTTRLKDIIDVVESVLATGVPRSAVIDELAAYGLKMTYYSFDSALKRIRKKRAKQTNPSVNKPIQKTVQTIANKSVIKSDIKEPEDDSEPSVGSSDPSDLTAIMRSTPDLEYYAKKYKESKRSKKV